MCGGVLHRWQYALELAQDPSSESRIKYRAGIDQRWEKESSKRKTKRGPGKLKRAVATDSAVADLIDWLAEHPDTIEHIRKIGKALAEDAAEKLDKQLDPANRENERRALTNHFWCDLLVAIVRIMAGFRKLTERVIEDAASIVLDTQKRKKHSPVSRIMTRVAVQIALKPIRSLIPSSALQATRMLAILICPAPEDHLAVADHCIEPLTKTGEISAATRERLSEIFPHWPLEIQGDLAI